MTARNRHRFLPTTTTATLVLILATLAALATSTPAYALGRIYGWAGKGGQIVVTSTGSISTGYFQQSFPRSTVSIYAHNTVNLVATYADSAAVTSKANPLTADNNSYWFAYVAPGRYDVTVSGGGLASPYTTADIAISDISGSTSVTVVSATSYTSGAGTLASPYTSATGTGGIQEAYTALTAASPTYGAVYAPAGYYSITRTNGINFALNSAVQVGNLAGTGGITFYGDGSINTILLGSTLGPVIDTTGQGHMTMRDFAIKSGTTNRSTTGILQGRSTLGLSAFPQHTTIERVYMDMVSDVTANGGKGVVGIYNRGAESCEYVNNEIYTDNPLVFTTDDAFSISSGNVTPNTTLRFTSNNHIRGGMYRTKSTLPTSAAIILQGATDGTTIDGPVLQKDTASNVNPLYAIRGLDHVTSAYHTAGDQISNIHIGGIQVENFARVLNLTAQWWAPHITGACGQEILGGGTFILLSATNAKIKNGYINIAAAQEVTTGQVIADGGTATGGVYNTTVFLPASLNVIMTASPGVGNRIYSDGNVGTPYFTSPQDPSAIVQTTAGMQLSGLSGRTVTVTLVNGVNDNIDTQGATIIRIVGPTGAFTIGGFTNTGSGRWLEVFDTVAQTMTIGNNSAGSSVGQKINTLQSANVVLRAANMSYASFMYDSTLGFWILKSYN
jgi:hypothetical protein